MKDFDRNLKDELQIMFKQKEDNDKQLLNMETFIGITTLLMFLSLVLITSFAFVDDWFRFVIIGVGLLLFLIICFLLLKIEQLAGYYECGCCHYKYVPTYFAICFSMHIGRTRYMKCPKCGKKSWQKKVLKRNEV